MTVETDEKQEPLPDRSRPRYRVQSDEKLETGLQSSAPRELNIRLLDISESGAKVSVDGPLRPNEPIRLRLKHADGGMEIALSATVRWCHLKRDSWEAGVSFTDTTIADDALRKLAMDGVVERRSEYRHPVDLEAMLKTPGDPFHTGIIISDVSSTGACLFTPRPVDVGKPLLLTVNKDEPEEPVSFVAVSRWQKERGAGYQLGCEVQSTSGPSVLQACGIEEKAPSRLASIPLRRIRAHWLTWTVLAVCSACVLTLAYPNLGWNFAELRETDFLQSITQLWSR